MAHVCSIELLTLSPYSVIYKCYLILAYKTGGAWVQVEERMHCSVAIQVLTNMLTIKPCRMAGVPIIFSLKWCCKYEIFSKNWTDDPAIFLTDQLQN